MTIYYSANHLGFLSKNDPDFYVPFSTTQIHDLELSFETIEAFWKWYLNNV